MQIRLVINNLTKHTFVCSLISTITFFSLSLNAQNADSIAHLMFNKTKAIKTLTYVMEKKERINGELKAQTSFVKLNRHPFKVYTKQLSPDEGIEVLYLEGRKTALINPNGFPWFNIKLDPYGGRMTKDQHHTIFDSGFDRFISILEYLFDKYGAEIESMATVKDYHTEDGRDCWLLEFDNPHFKIIDYKLKANENLLTLSDERFISSYMILTLNKNVDDYKDVNDNQVIKIPNDYSPTMSLLIDKDLLVPLEIMVYYKDQLFEHYHFSDININPSLTTAEFTPEYSDYGF